MVLIYNHNKQILMIIIENKNIYNKIIYIEIQMVIQSMIYNFKKIFKNIITINIMNKKIIIKKKHMNNINKVKNKKIKNYYNLLIIIKNFIKVIHQIQILKNNIYKQKI